MVAIGILALLSLAGSSAAQSYSASVPFSSGFNLGSEKPSGECRTVEEWADEFRRVRALSTSSNNFDHVKLFTASRCDQANLAAQAALQTGTKVWQGIWVGGGTYEKDLEALRKAIENHGSQWLAGINVGSEEIYRGDITGQELADRIRHTKQVIQGELGATNVPIAMTDTWNAYILPETAPAIDASDIIMVNAFPYWEVSSPEEALTKFQEGIQRTVNVIGDKPLVIGETGWPTGGSVTDFSIRHGEAGLANAARYWKEAACYLTRQRIPFYWFEAFDEPNKAGYEHPEANFGVATAEGKLKYDLEC